METPNSKASAMSLDAPPAPDGSTPSQLYSVLNTPSEAAAEDLVQPGVCPTAFGHCLLACSFCIWSVSAQACQKARWSYCPSSCTCRGAFRNHVTRRHWTSSLLACRHIWLYVRYLIDMPEGDIRYDGRVGWRRACPAPHRPFCKINWQNLHARLEVQSIVSFMKACESRHSASTSWSMCWYV